MKVATLFLKAILLKNHGQPGRNQKRKIRGLPARMAALAEPLIKVVVIPKAELHQQVQGLTLLLFLPNTKKRLGKVIQAPAPERVREVKAVKQEEVLPMMKEVPAAPDLMEPAGSVAQAVVLEPVEPVPAKPEPVVPGMQGQAIIQVTAPVARELITPAVQVLAPIKLAEMTPFNNLLYTVKLKHNY